MTLNLLSLSTEEPELLAFEFSILHDLKKHSCLLIDFLLFLFVLFSQQSLHYFIPIRCVC